MCYIFLDRASFVNFKLSVWGFFVNSVAVFVDPLKHGFQEFLGVLLVIAAECRTDFLDSTLQRIGGFSAGAWFSFMTSNALQ